MGWARKRDVGQSLLSKLLSARSEFPRLQIDCVMEDVTVQLSQAQGHVGGLAFVLLPLRSQVKQRLTAVLSTQDQEFGVY